MYLILNYPTRVEDPGNKSSGLGGPNGSNRAPGGTDPLEQSIFEK